jgi:voltage-gated potassium channel
MAQKVHLFGYGKHGKRIAKGLQESGYVLHILEADSALTEKAKQMGFVDVDHIDMADDDQIEALRIEEDDLVVCVMDDEHLNVFLTLTLRQFHHEVQIFSISDSIHTAEKLTMAGASKVIDLYHVSATRIHNYLNKPVTTHLLSGILGDKHDISFREFVIPDGSFLHGINTESIDFDRFNLLFLGLIDKELGSDLIFVTEGFNHKLDSGDILVFMGRDDDLDRFDHTIKKEAVEMNKEEKS